MQTASRIILQVEDSEDDVFIMKRVLRKAGFDLPHRVLWSGQEALDYLAAAMDPARRRLHPLPCLLLLDLKLPGRDGFEILEWVRRQPALEGLPVVMLTGSGDIRDRRRAIELGATAYLIKPATLDDVRILIKSLGLQALMGTGSASGAP